MRGTLGLIDGHLVSLHGTEILKMSTKANVKSVSLNHRVDVVPSVACA